MNTKNKVAMPKWLVPHFKSKGRKFKQAAMLVDLVIDKKAPALLLCGNPGTGKSRLVRARFDDKLQLEGFHYRIVKGHGSALGLYSLLYECRKQILVLDDADSLFQDPRSTNILKAALESYDAGRKISWQSQSAKNMDVPMEFNFEGAVIFISNIAEDEMNSAVLSRSFHYNLVLSPEEILATMYQLLPRIEEQVSVEDKLEALKFIESKREDLVASGKFNLRTLVNGIRIKANIDDPCPETGEPMWQELLRICA